MTYTHMCVYIYIHTYIHMCVCPSDSSPPLSPLCLHCFTLGVCVCDRHIYRQTVTQIDAWVDGWIGVWMEIWYEKGRKDG